MSEPVPGQFEDEKERKKREYIAVARELSQRPEAFPFPGIDPASYPKLQAAEEQFPGLVTPVDELLERFRTEGLKVVFGSDEESGNVFVLPSNSNNIEQDGLFPRHLALSEGMDEDLARLISAYK